MSRPPMEVADLIRNAGAAFIERNRPWIRWKHVKVLLAIARCRTAALLTYNATPNNEPFYADFLPISYYGDYSVGITVKKDGTIFDVFAGTPGYDAGLGPNMTILAVDGHVYSAAALNEAVANPRNGKISLVVRNFDSVETREIQYAGGVRYPHLEPIPGSHDYLSEILTPRSHEEH
jgi:hypothetical protein